MIVNCEFTNGHNYRCLIQNQEIPSSEDDLIFQGQHQPGKTNEDVKILRIQNCKMSQLPQSIGQAFKNIELLYIEKSNVKSLTRFDLKQFENLKKIQVFANNIKFLPGDLFEFTKNIDCIDFSGNKTKFIGPNLLDGLENLKVVDLRDNVNINHYYGPGSSIGFTLEQLKEKIRTDCKPPIDEREMLKFYGRDPDEGNPQAQQKLMKKPHKFHNELKEFLELDDFKDFTIKVADSEFKVHKFLFAVRSQTFAELIKNNPEAENLELQDIPVEVFECILSFVYTDELPETQNIHEVFAAAGKLKMKGLIELTSRILASSIENEKDLLVLHKIMSLAVKFEHEELKLKAFVEIKKHFPGRNLADELADQPEKLKTLIDAKLSFDQHFKDLEI